MDEAIALVMEGDTTLMGLLPGGVHVSEEISREHTPSAFDASRELQPCALVRLETEIPYGPHQTSSRAFVRIHLYQLYGYSNIEGARQRLFALLHRQRVETAGFYRGVWEARSVNDIPRTEDQVLNANMGVCRYEVYANRGSA